MSIFLLKLKSQSDITKIDFVNNWLHIIAFNDLSMVLKK